MQHLDLTTDAPSEFEGRVVSLRGCEYVIGPSFREDDQGFAHLLRNRESGLCLHVIQVRPEYMTDPDMALAASKHKAEVTSKFRSQMRLKQPGVAIPTISVVEAHGGSFELHEGRWGLFSSGLDKEPGIEIFNEAVGILESGDALAAEARIRSLLGGSPRHTEALSLLADCLDDQGKSAEALEVMWQINAIEPNASRYQGRTVFYSLKAPPRSSAIAEFEALKNRFPLVDDYNIYGIEAYLGCAMIEKARELLDASVLDDDTRKELQTRVDEALAVDTAYKIIDAKVASKDYPDDPGGYADLVAELEPLLQRYPENPWIQANLGFTMAAAGKPEQAVSLLSDAAGGLTPILSAYCYANAGFALVEMEKWNLALSSFNLSMLLLKSSDPQGELKPADAPGVTRWIFREGELQEALTRNPSELIGRAIKNTTSPDAITPDVRELATLYEAAQEIYEYPVANPSIPKRRGRAGIITASVGVVLTMFTFIGAVTTLTPPYSLDKTGFGILILIPLAQVYSWNRKNNYLQESTGRFFWFLLLPSLAFIGGIVVAIVRLFSL